MNIYRCIVKGMSVIFLVIGLHFSPVYSVKNNTIITQNEYLKKIYDDAITTEELTDFAYQLLQERIDHWQQLFYDAKRDNDADVLSTIPLYIKLKSNIAPSDMLKKCFITKCTDNDLGGTYCDYKGFLAVEIDESIRKKITLFLYVLHHELTHVEQHANWFVIKEKLKLKVPAKDPFYTHKEANQIYRDFLENNCLKPAISNNAESETEADTQGIFFYHNHYMFISTFKNWNFSKNLVKQGYLSQDETEKYVKLRYDNSYKNNSKKLDRHKKEYETWNTLYEKFKKQDDRTIALDFVLDDKPPMLLLNLDAFKKN